jgi:hypothetical protein
MLNDTSTRRAPPKAMAEANSQAFAPNMATSHPKTISDSTAKPCCSRYENPCASAAISSLVQLAMK